MQRLFGQRDWSPGEPYLVGGFRLGIVTPASDAEEFSAADLVILCGLVILMFSAIALLAVMMEGA
jgi:hypothetical protein